MLVIGVVDVYVPVVVAVVVVDVIVVVLVVVVFVVGALLLPLLLLSPLLLLPLLHLLLSFPLSLFVFVAVHLAICVVVVVVVTIILLNQCDDYLHSFVYANAHLLEGMPLFLKFDYRRAKFENREVNEVLMASAHRIAQGLLTL